jgi:hypothetical protein
MLDPCYTAMLDGAIMANNPPVGLTAVPQDGSNASSQINALLAALPHANTNTRNVYFFRPTTRYKINARLDITVDGTAVLCGGVPKITLQNTTSFSLVSEDQWFRGSSLSPHIRIDNVDYVHWQGGGFKGRDAQSGGTATQTVFELGTARFCTISNFYSIYVESFLQCNGLNGGEYSEFCIARDSKNWRQDGSSAPNAQFGTDNIRATSGKARLCGLHGFWGVGGNPHNMTFDETEDCFTLAGYSEFSASTAGNFLAGSLRTIWIGTNIEGATSPTIASGASFTSIGHSGWGTGSGDIYKFG